MAKKQPIIVYEPRERLDGELEGAIADIISAEDEAKRIIEQASASVKAIQLDGATFARQQKELAERNGQELVTSSIKQAESEADGIVAQMTEQAKKEGEALLKDKKKQIDVCATKLFERLRGKKG